MSTSALEGEDLENVPLVRMEDVQPSRERIVETRSASKNDSEVYEICIIDKIEFENECVVNSDEDSTVGSAGSVKSEDGDADSEIGELIVPEVLDRPLEIPVETPINIQSRIPIKTSQPDQWPTLEILPGGVIKNGDKADDIQESNKKEMVYACAQCSQGFKYLFLLVQHIRWHANQKKQLTKIGLDKLNIERKIDEYICMSSGRKNIVITNTKGRKRKVPKRLKS